MTPFPIPLISIILPVYNGQSYITDAVLSIKAQTYSNFELIIVDDCSTDHTHEIIKKLAQNDLRIKIITNPKNFKLPKSLNLGFKQAKGEFHTWTSDDNVLHPHFLETLYSELISNGADIVYSDYNIINENAYFQYRVNTGPDCLLILKNSIGASFLYKKEVFNKLNGYAENLFLIEDFDYWVRAKLQGFIFFHIPQTLYDYRIHGNSLSSTEKISQILIPYLEKNILLFPNVNRYILFKAHTNLIYNGRKILPLKSTLRLVVKAFLLSPFRTLFYALTKFKKMAER